MGLIYFSWLSINLLVETPSSRKGLACSIRALPSLNDSDLLEVSWSEFSWGASAWGELTMLLLVGLPGQANGLVL